MRSHFVHENLFVLGGVELRDVWRVDRHQLVDSFLKFGALFGVDLLHLS